MTDPHTIAAGLTKAQREALLGCCPWDIAELPAGVAVRFCQLGFLRESTICDDGVELTPLGQQVKAILKNNHG